LCSQVRLEEVEIMKSAIAKYAFLTLALSGILSFSALAQTTEETPAPSDQPSAPMEIGQPGPIAQPPDAQSTDAEPTDAQPGGPSGEAPVKTDQGVARISLIHGEVSTQRGDSGDWSAAILNQPVMTGDKVSTGDNARTELQLDFANILRLGANSKANIATLTQKDIQIQLAQGIANYTVSKDSEAEPEIDTPNVSVHPAHHDGVFRIEVRPDGDTIVIVRQGEAQIATPQGSTEVRSGEMATIRGDADSAQYKISPAPERDSWDQWNSDRDHLIRNASSWRHTNRYYTGTQDLDAYGQWKNVPDYGDVWVPNEPDGWVPYRNGNWTYQPYYGWTWVGYEPWGWAPYHYGRWFYYGNSWAWWPGPVYGGGFYRPFWAPAYVSFWGWGGGFGFGIGFGGWGGFGWLPVGPCDYYHPWWGGYRGRFGVVAVHGGYGRYGGFAPLHGGNRFSNIANMHDNHVGRALSTMNAGRFGAGRFTAGAATREQIGGARMMAGNLPVVPSHASLSASGRAAAPSTVRNGSQRFFGSAHNNVARPASFQQQTASLRQTMQQNHVGGIPAGGRAGSESGGFHGTSASSNLQRPSAGTLSNREMSNPGSRGATDPSPAENGGHAGYRPFTPPSSNAHPSAPAGSERTQASPGSAAPQRGTMQTSPAGNRDGFRPFTPPSGNEASRGQANAAAGRGSGGYWNRTAPSVPESRGVSSYPGGYGRGSSSRPQLDMRQPIARAPSYGGNPRGGYGGYHVPSYGGSHSAPGYGGSHSAPSYGGGGHASAPSGGGGHSSGGGGGHSSSGGGGHSSGGGHH
jgi:FecR protein